jgi:NAD+ kinase
MNLALHGRPFSDSARHAIQSFFDELVQRQYGVQVSASFQAVLAQAGVTHPFAERTFTEQQGLGDPDFIVSLGGDGTLLESVTYVGERQVPIVGVNFGRLGFLATIAPGKLQDTLNALEAGQFSLDDRVLVRVDSEKDVFGGLNFGLNDFTISKTESSSMIVVHAYLDGKFLNSYWADGLVISTPTGSTGYCLSVGGPVVLPHSGNFIVAPMCPHNLNVRPLVVNDSSVIAVTVESRSKNFLVALDSRSRIVDESVRFMVRKENFVARLVKMPGDNFLDTLRSKLNWGLDIRN